MHGRSLLVTHGLHGLHLLRLVECGRGGALLREWRHVLGVHWRLAVGEAVEC